MRSAWYVSALLASAGGFWIACGLNPQPIPPGDTPDSALANQPGVGLDSGGGFPTGGEDAGKASQDAGPGDASTDAGDGGQVDGGSDGGDAGNADAGDDGGSDAG